MENEVAQAAAVNWPFVVAAFSLGLAAFGSAMGLGRAVNAAMDAMARQPEIQPKIQVSMIIGCALIEALTIYALVAVLVVPFLG